MRGLESQFRVAAVITAVAFLVSKHVIGFLRSKIFGGYFTIAYLVEQVNQML